jgi:predicted small integral membrane protein
LSALYGLQGFCVVVRLAKIGCVGAVALFMALVAFGNVTDYWTNFAYVAHVLDMDGIPGGSMIGWRALASPALHHAAYLAIIATEIAITALMGVGLFSMIGARKAEGQAFARAKGPAIIGLALGFLLFEGGFVAIGGEWFGMWRSPLGAETLPSAFRIAITMLGVLIFIAMKDEDLG